ncbi:MAG: S9 family peptidase [Pseudoxanthomonas sp.]|nr:S9 family peptidase [Pseudoxanthomonas sp.]
MRIVSVVALLLAIGICAPAMAQVDVAAYLKRDKYERIKISPTGEYLAVTVPLEDRTALAIVRRSDKTMTAKAVGAEHSLIDDFWWANDERVVLAIAQRLGTQDAPFSTGELHAVNADGSRPMLLASPAGISDMANAGGTTRLAPGAAVFMIDPLAGDDRNILVSAMQLTADPQTRVEKMDIYSRNRTTVATAPVRNASFAVDGAGQVRFARGAGFDNVSKLYYRDERGQDWRLVNDEAESGVVVDALGFSQDGKTAYLRSEVSGGPDAIFAYDPLTDKRSPLIRDPVADPLGIIERLDSHEPAGAWFMSAGIRSRFFDEKSPTARLYRSLERAFPGHAVAVTSTTHDGRLALLHVWSDRNSGDFYLFDTTTKQADLLYSRREWFEPAKVSPSRAIEVTARDGMKLHGYLNLPVGQEKQLPLVVLPHGGPYGVFDRWEFDDSSQMLTEAGYAVLRLNYRGSSNYGRDYSHAGARQWGKRMQDDLTDATRWAIEQKIADPSRICIYGASYGGYAALMGAAKEPSLYKCAVGYVGVYDLEKMHKDDAKFSRSWRTWTEEWLGERDTLAEVSPVNFAGRIKVPVFLAAGGQDERAPVEHTRRMEKALQQAGVPVESLYFKSEGHGFFKEEHRREYYTRLLAFLSVHLGGARAR